MMKTIKRYLNDPKFQIGKWLYHRWPNILPDKWYLEVMWKICMGYPLNLKNPQSFNEKLQWLKLYDRNPLYTTLVDKLEVKKWVADKIGEEYVIPTLAVYNSVDEIDLDKLPDKFVLKCTHDSGSVIICQDKQSFDLDAAKIKLSKALKYNYYWGSREWPYKNVHRRIIAEEYLETNCRDLFVYKFFVYDGVVRYFKVDFDRRTNHGANYYDRNGNLLDFGENVCPQQKNKQISLPSNLDEMIEKAESLCLDIKQVRVDFYNVDGEIRFGEYTFYLADGFGAFSDSCWDRKLGEYIQITDKQCFKSDVGGVKDYKFFCFDGQVEFFRINFDKETEPHANFYDSSGNLLPFGEMTWTRQDDVLLGIPINLDVLIGLAEKLSENMPFVRVDFYDNHGDIKFGECTFYPDAGFGKLTDEEWELKMGKMIRLSNRKD